MDDSYHIDMHVHSAKYSACAESLDPWKIAEFATEAKLHGLVVTEHDTLWPKDEFVELLQSCHKLQLFRGIEVSTQNGPHLVILGIEENGPLHKGISCDDAIRYAHSQGGMVILAHPFRNGLPPLRIIEEVDAIEVGSTSLYEKEANLSLHLAEKLKKPAIASSDAHALPMIGWAYTSFPRKPDDIKDLCLMIKKGLGKPVLPNPFFG